MSKNFSVDDTLYRAQAKKLVKQLKLDEEEFIREQGALYARAMSKATPPHAGGRFPQLKKAGYQEGTIRETLSQAKSAIISDMNTMFVVKSSGYLESVHDITGTLRNIRRTLTNGKGVKYVIDVNEINYDSLNRALEWGYKMRRPSDGRARNKNQGSNDPRIGRWTARDRMWITPEIWKQVLKAKFDNVGMSKAAFATAAVQLGIKQKPPKYIKDMMYGQKTSVIMQENPTVVKIKASAPGLSHAARLAPQVERFRMIAMVKRLKFLVRANAKKAGFKVK